MPNDKGCARSTVVRVHRDGQADAADLLPGDVIDLIIYCRSHGRAFMFFNLSYPDFFSTQSTNQHLQPRLGRWYQAQAQEEYKSPLWPPTTIPTITDQEVNNRALLFNLEQCQAGDKFACTRALKLKEISPIQRALARATYERLTKESSQPSTDKLMSLAPSTAVPRDGPEGQKLTEDLAKGPGKELSQPPPDNVRGATAKPSDPDELERWKLVIGVASGGLLMLALLLFGVARRKEWFPRASAAKRKGPTIFISYRRDDGAANAARISDRLATEFGAANIFMDIDKLIPGQRFDKELQEALLRCDFFIVIIGSRWFALLGEKQSGGKRDYARIELAAALEREIPVIPVLVENSKLPDEEALPLDIQRLVLHHKHDIAFEHFSRDVAGLIAAIHALHAIKPRHGSPSAS